MTDAETRYAEIARRLAQRQAAAAAQAHQDTLAGTLDALDAWGTLDAVQRDRRLRGRLFGPKIIRHTREPASVGVVNWLRGSGYHGYRVLRLLGVWALTAPDAADSVTLVVASKALAYSAPTYEAEAYYKLIRRDFTVYYRDDSAVPPAATRLWTAPYVAAQRLALRQQLGDALELLTRQYD